jgi:hypothetical protein
LLDLLDTLDDVEDLAPPTWTLAPGALDDDEADGPPMLAADRVPSKRIARTRRSTCV